MRLPSVMGFSAVAPVAGAVGMLLDPLAFAPVVGEGSLLLLLCGGFCFGGNNVADFAVLG